MKIVLATGLAVAAIAGFASAACGAQGMSIEIKAPNDMAIVLRPSAVGTNVRTSKVMRTQLPDGRLGQMVLAGLQPAMIACAAPRGLKVVIEESRMRDVIGDSATQLEGIGVYASLPDLQSTAGNWYVAPFVALRLVALDGVGKRLKAVEVARYDKQLIPPDSVASTYLVENAAKLEQMLEVLVAREVAASAAALLGAEVCA